MDNDMIKNMSDEEVSEISETREVVKEEVKPSRKRNTTKSQKQQAEKVETVDFKCTEESPIMKNIIYPVPIYLAASDRSPIIGMTSGKCKVINTKDDWINIKVGVPGKGAVVGYIKKSSTCIRSI